MIGTIPWPLRWRLGIRAEAFDRDLAHAIHGDADLHFPGLNFTRDIGPMAPNGFHQEAEFYAE